VLGKLVSEEGKRECWRRRTGRGVFYTTGEEELKRQMGGGWRKNGQPLCLFDLSD
jgi:hypothetical protein